jgi:dethiobiotin synthetase
VNALVVTGTGTEVGKTIVTAAIAALARADRRNVAVVKLAQTGIEPGDESDVDVVRRLSGVDDVHELVRYPEPLAPATAARRAGLEATPVGALATQVHALDDRDLVVVEGAGGLLVHMDGAGGTLADVARALGAPVVVVAAPGLGTLNAIALTTEALRRRDLECLGVVFGSWPADPDLAARANVGDVSAYAKAPLLGMIPAGAGRLDAAAFGELARRNLAPVLGGTWTYREE